jgi:hypothetical protein
LRIGNHVLLIRIILWPFETLLFLSSLLQIELGPELLNKRLFLMLEM